LITVLTPGAAAVGESDHLVMHGRRDRLSTEQVVVLEHRLNRTGDVGVVDHAARVPNDELVDDGGDAGNLSRRVDRGLHLKGRRQFAGECDGSVSDEDPDVVGGYDRRRVESFDDRRLDLMVGR
jgi:hypothetical protein